MIDHKKLAVIHIVKRELGLSDKEYRDIMEHACGERSARDLDEAGFRKLMRVFARSKYYWVNRQGLTLRQKLYIKYLVKELEWDAAHFKNFLKKYYHHTTIDRCSKKEAGKVIESLKQIKKRHKQDAAPHIT
jgi:hypothetical protein